MLRAPCALRNNCLHPEINRVYVVNYPIYFRYYSGGGNNSISTVLFPFIPPLIKHSIIYDMERPVFAIMLDTYKHLFLDRCCMNTTTKLPEDTNTHIAVVLDRSGSMDTMAKEIIGGFNAFLEDQKKVPGKATMTLVQFDNDLDRLASFEPLDKIQPLTGATYVPRGATRLYDAIGLTVNSVKEAIGAAAEKPDKVLVVILTDGMENASQEYTTEQIKALLQAHQADGWQFTFIGANQDAILSARGIGLNNAASNLTYSATPDGAKSMMGSLSSATAQYRCSIQGTAFCYVDSDRQTQSINPSQAGSYSSKAAFNEHGSTAGTKGGPARAASLTPERRSEIAKLASKARWSNKSVP